MPTYDATTLARLFDKLDYEIWLLEFLAKTEQLIEGGAGLETIKLTNNRTTAGICVGIATYVGADYVQRVMDAISPLVFTASYKILDMIYEWILEVNVNVGVIRKVPWRFCDKIALIDSTNLICPPLFVANSYLRDYSYAFFIKLLPYRNEVVHNHNFSVDADQLKLVNSKTGAKLILDRRRLGCLVRFVVALAKCLGGKIPFSSVSDRLFKYHLDELGSVHRLAAFGQTFPLLVNVELTVQKEGETFPANLRQVRETVRRVHPNVDALFNLTVLGFEGDALVAKWYFPAGDVPTCDLEGFEPDSHAGFRQPDGM